MATLISILITIVLIIIVSYIIHKISQGGTNTLKTDMSNKICIITGASAGLGFYHAKNLIESNAKVIFACRNKEKAEKMIKTLPEDKQKNAEFMYIDLCKFKTIKEFSEKILQKFPEKIDLLVNNAGAFPTSKFMETEDGLDSFVQGNHLGPMYLTLLLINHMKPKGRIIFLSSLCHFMADLKQNSGDLLSDNKYVKEYFFRNFARRNTLYSNTKLLNLYTASYLDDLFKERKIELKACCLHPGACQTEFNRYIEDYGIFGKIIDVILIPIYYLFFKSAEQGAQTQIYLSHLDYEKIKGGAYYADCKVHYKSTRAEDKNLRKTMIDWSLNEIRKRQKEIGFNI